MTPRERGAWVSGGRHWPWTAQPLRARGRTPAVVDARSQARARTTSVPFVLFVPMMTADVDERVISGVTRKEERHPTTAERPALARSGCAVHGQWRPSETQAPRSRGDTLSLFPHPKYLTITHRAVEFSPREGVGVLITPATRRRRYAYTRCLHHFARHLPPQHHTFCRFDQRLCLNLL